jgi:hypothetical protein
LGAHESAAHMITKHCCSCQLQIRQHFMFTLLLAVHPTAGASMVAPAAADVRRVTRPVAAVEQELATDCCYDCDYNNNHDDEMIDNGWITEW